MHLHNMLFYVKFKIYSSLHLMTYHAVLIVRPVIRTGSLGAREKTVHLVLVQIYQTVIVFLILVKNIIDASVTIRRHMFSSLKLPAYPVLLRFSENRSRAYIIPHEDADRYLSCSTPGLWLPVSWPLFRPIPAYDNIPYVPLWICPPRPRYLPAFSAPDFSPR